MNEIKISSGQILALLAMKYAFWPAIIILTLFLAAIVLGIFVDPRWIAMAFIVLCFLLPLAAAFLYFWYALRPFTVYNTLPHSFTFTTEAIRLTIKKSFPSSEELRPDADCEEEHSEVEISLKSISSVELWGSGLVLFVGPEGKQGLLIIPSGILSSVDTERILNNVNV